MDYQTIRLLEALLLPPGGIVLVGLLGLLFIRHKFGRRLTFIGLLLLYLSSIPLVSNALLNSLVVHPATTPETLKSTEVDALLVLGGGYYGEAEEYGDSTVGPFFMERLRYAAWLYRRTGIPIIVSSGRSDAHTAARILVEEFGAPVLAVEDRSWNTWDNAHNTTELVAAKDLKNLALITHGWHMPRAAFSFNHAGATFVTAPMGLTHGKADYRDWNQWIPNSLSLLRTRYTLHEYLGMLWYQVREEP
ncbi:MAG: YdcF family protein [Pseudomonadota bacterium]